MTLQRYNILKYHFTLSDRYSYLLVLSHTFSLGRCLGGLWLAQEVEDMGYLHRGEVLVMLAVSALVELLQEVGIALYPSHQMSTCHRW